MLALALSSCSGGAADNATVAAVETPSPRATPSPAPPERIADGANILSAAQKADLLARMGSLEARTKRRVVVATFTSLGGLDIEAVAEDIGNRLGVVDGVVLVVVIQDREYQLAVGPAAVGRISRRDAARIAKESLAPDLHANRFDAGIVKGVDRIIAELSETIA